MTRFKFCMKIINDLDHCAVVVTLNEAQMMTDYGFTLTEAKAIKRKARNKLNNAVPTKYWSDDREAFVLKNELTASDLIKYDLK